MRYQESYDCSIADPEDFATPSTFDDAAIIDEISVALAKAKIGKKSTS